MTVIVEVNQLLTGVRCQTREHMVIEARFIGHLRVEVCGPDGHASAGEIEYRLEGPGGTFTGTTGRDGRIRHEDVVAGDYILRFPDRKDLERVVSTSARRGVWQRTTALLPRERF